MYVGDLRRDFFAILRNQRVVVFADSDVDSICAVKIISSLFQSDQILYTIVPITGESL